MATNNPDFKNLAEKIVNKLDWRAEYVKEISMKEGYNYCKWFVNVSEDMRVIIYPYSRVVVTNPKKDTQADQYYLSIMTCCDGGKILEWMGSDFEYKCHCIKAILEKTYEDFSTTTGEGKINIFKTLMDFAYDDNSKFDTKKSQSDLANEIADSIKWVSRMVPSLTVGGAAQTERWIAHISDKVSICFNPMGFVSIYNKDTDDSYFSFAFSKYPYEIEDEYRHRAIEVIVKTAVTFGVFNRFDRSNPYCIVLEEIMKFHDKLKRGENK